MSTQMMKAVQQHAFGGPEVLSYEDAPMPVLQAGEVLVQVHAVGVNPPDSYLRDGYQQLPPEWRPEVRFPLILGTDLSGVVVPLAGKRVLVNGAAGGVGHFAVQLAKWQGAEVIAVAAGRHEAFLRQLGTDSVIDYTTTAVEETVRDLDLVIDAPGGPASGRFLRTLRPGGALYPIFPLGFAGAEEARQRGVTVSTTQVRSSGAQLARLADLLDAGVIRVAIDSVFPLAQAQMAHERAAQGHLEGKIVLSVMDSSAG
ncbi:TPA: NADP-dependent oxidoreductase [Klebsiella pneumoniae]